MELAAVLPVLLLLVVTAVDLGRAYYYYTQMANAVRVGAAYAVNEGSALTWLTVDERKGRIENYILDHCDLSPEPESLVIASVSGTGLMKPGDVDEIVAAHKFEFITPLARTLVGGDGTLQLRYSLRITYT